MNLPYAKHTGKTSVARGDSSVMAWSCKNAAYIPEAFFKNFDYNLHKYDGKDDNFYMMEGSSNEPFQKD